VIIKIENEKAKERIERVKAHFEKHKTIYYCVGTGFLTAGITAVVMRGRYAGIQRVPDGSDMITIRPLSILSRQNVVTVLERDGKGHPGYIIKCLETGQVFPSQASAAKTLGLYPSAISGHLNGKESHAGGFHFERVSIAA
jgi:hypothetical protein